MHIKCTSAQLSSDPRLFCFHMACIISECSHLSRKWPASSVIHEGPDRDAGRPVLWGHFAELSCEGDFGSADTGLDSWRTNRPHRFPQLLYSIYGPPLYLQLFLSIESTPGQAVYSVLLFCPHFPSQSRQMAACPEPVSDGGFFHFHLHQCSVCDFAKWRFSTISWLLFLIDDFY